MLLSCFGRSCINKGDGSLRVFQNVSEFIIRSNHSCSLQSSPKEGRQVNLEESYTNLQCAVNKLEQMHGKVDVSTYASLLSLSAQARDLWCGKQIHDHLKKSKWGESSYLGSLVVHMYIKCGTREQAYAFFEGMPKPNVYSWSHLIGAYATEDGHLAWQLFDRMQWEGVWPQKITFVSLLSGYLNALALNRVRQLHLLIIERGFHTSVKLGTALMAMYAKCSSLEAARGIFDRMLDRDVVSWNAMIAAYNQQGSFRDAFQIFLLMQEDDVEPTISTFSSTIDACTGHAALIEGKRVHAYVTSAGLDCDIVVATALINMYGKCGSLDDAQIVFTRSKDRDAVLWNTMIAVLTLHAQHASILQLFGHMRSEGWIGDQATFVSIFSSCASQIALNEGKRMHTHAIWLNLELDVEVGSTIVDMYGKCANIKEAEKLFSRLESRDLLAWTSMIAAYAQNEQGKEALQLFNQMKKGKMSPDKVAFLGILPAYASQAMLMEAQLMHTDLCYMGLDCDVEIANALITMYGKCGSLTSAHKVFDIMLLRDLISWNALLTAYAQHGHGKEVLELYNQLETAGIKPDCITYMSVFLGCSHSGLLEEGHRCLVSMTQEYGILPKAEHLNCLIDLLARAGQLDEAERLLQSLQSESTYSHWVTLLGACRSQLDVERGERAATRAFTLDSSNKSPYILLANIYALASKVKSEENIPGSGRQGHGCW